MRAPFIAFALLACLASLAPAPAMAQGGDVPITQPDQVLDTLTAEAVGSLVAELGGKEVEIRDLEGGKVVIFVDAGIPYQLSVAGCESIPGKCISLVMLVFVETGASGITTDMVNSGNLEEFFITSLKVDDKTMAFGRGLLVAGGVTRRNLAMNIGVYANRTGEALKHFASKVVASNALPGAPQNLSMGAGKINAVRPTDEQLSAALKAHNARLKAAVAGSKGF